MLTRFTIGHTISVGAYPKLVIDNPNNTIPNPHSNHSSHQSTPPNRSRAYTKTSQIHTDRAKEVITCYRCREKNHTSRECGNALVCFECGGLDHKLANSRAITLLLKQNTTSTKALSHHIQTRTISPSQNINLQRMQKCISLFRMRRIRSQIG
jgi:Zinc knuckle